MMRYLGLYGMDFCNRPILLCKTGLNKNHSGIDHSKQINYWYNLSVRLVLVLIFCLATQWLSAQCIISCNQNAGVFTNNDPSTIAYDNMVSSHHSTVVSEDQGFMVWGEAVDPSGSPALSPTRIDASNYPALTGAVYAASLGGTGFSQLIVLTSTGLFVCGDTGAVLHSSLVATRSFQKLTINGKGDGLPTGITPDSVKMLFVTRETIILTTCSGRVYVLSRHVNVRGDSGLGNTGNWSQVMINTGVPLTSIIAARGGARFGFALRSDNTLWTWGDATHLGDGSSQTHRSLATQMTMPSGCTKIRMIQGMYGGVAGHNYYVLDTNNQVFCLGLNSFGQVMDTGLFTRTTWIQARYGNGTLVNDARWISANEHANGGESIAMINSRSQVYTAGYNSGLMLGRAVNAGVNYLGIPTGISATDSIFFCEVGGHTSAYIRKNTARYGYVGHKINGSMGDGSAVNTSVFPVNFTLPPIVRICGTNCDTPKVMKLPYNCVDSTARFLFTGRFNTKIFFQINGVSDSVTIGAANTATYSVIKPSTNLNIVIPAVKGLYCDFSLNLRDTLRLFGVKDSFLSICRGQSVSFNGIVRSTTGLYRDTLTTTLGCDSFINLNLLVNDTTSQTLNLSICKNKPLLFNGLFRNTAGFYRDTLVNSRGCDSFLYLNLSILDTSASHIYDTICSNQFRSFNGQNQSLAGIYRDTLLNSQGCDSFLYLHLSVRPISTYRDTQTICANQSYFFNGLGRSSPGVYADTLLNSVGCDSFIYLHLSVSDTSTSMQYDTICANHPKLFNGKFESITGLYRDTMINSLGCDSFVNLYLTVKDTSSYQYNQSICKNLPIWFNGSLLKTSGLYKDTLVNHKGCDSFVYLSLSVNDTSTSNRYDTICSNSTLFFNNQLLSLAGHYLDTLTNSKGCDSIIHLYLTVKSTSSFSFSANICADSFYSFNGKQYTLSGIYYDTLLNSGGCDSFVTLSLKVNSLPTAIAGADQTRIHCPGDSIRLGTSAQSNCSYTWNPSLGLDAATVAQPWTKTSISTIYSLYVLDLVTRCTNRDTVEINVVNSSLNAIKLSKHLRCNNDSSGELLITAMNGFPPYQYKESKGLWQIAPTIKGLKAVTVDSFFIIDSKGCLVSDTYSLVQPLPLSIRTIRQQHLPCYQQAVGLIEVLAEGGAAPYSYMWDRSSITAPFIDNLEAGQYTVTVTDDSRCRVIERYTLNQPDSLWIRLDLLRNNVCKEDTKGEIKISVLGGTIPYSYSWSHGNQSNHLSNLLDGVYKLTVEDKKNCKNYSEYKIENPPYLQIDTIIGSDLDCDDIGQIQIKASLGVSPFSYSIDKAKSFRKNNSFIVSDSGLYFIAVRGDNGCLVYDSIYMKAKDKIIFKVLPEEQTIDLAESARLSFKVLRGDSSGIKDMLWTPSTGLSCTDCPNPIATPFATQQYNLEIKNWNGCVNRDYTTLTVLSNTELYVPNSFSPKADNIENRSFKAYALRVLRFEMSVFNRWGEKVFETDDIRQGWDGNYKGELAAKGVYTYTLRLTKLDGLKIVKSGEVNLF
jgi:gliding motility-associated-like protein